MKMNEPVDFRLNGETVSACEGETIIQAAKRHGFSCRRSGPCDTGIEVLLLLLPVL